MTDEQRMTLEKLANDLMDPIIDALKQVTKMSLETDKALAEVIQLLTQRVIALEKRVEMLADLHRLHDKEFN